MGKAKTVVKNYPFVEGQREDADSKVLPDGYVTRVKNMRLRADARWGVRYDYDALGRRTPTVTAIRATDLMTHDGRLHATAATFSTDTCPADLYSLVDQDQFEWFGTDGDNDQVRLNTFRALRDLGRPPLQENSVTRLDCAAAGGLVCMVYQTGTNGVIHIFNPVTDATVARTTVSSYGRPRVVAVGTVFWITMLSNSLSNCQLLSFDPANDDQVQLEGLPITPGGTINCYDIAPRLAGDGLILGMNTTAPATSIRLINSSGTVTTTFAGVAASLTHISLCESATRVNVLAVAAADSKGDLYSYTTAGALSTGPTETWGGVVVIRQPGIVLDTSGELLLLAELTATPERNTISGQKKSPTTHATSTTATWLDASLGTKPFRSDELSLVEGFGGVQSDSPGLTNFLGNAVQLIGACKDHFAAVKTETDHLPSVGFDSSTGLYYWPNLTDDGDGRAQPVVTEFVYADSGRHQTAQIGGLLYIAGAQIYVHDGRLLFEAGFTDAPTIISATPGNGAGGLPTSTTLLVAATYEWRDTKGNFHTSRPSLVETVTMGASDDTITVVVSGAHSARRNTSSDVTSGGITVVLWRSVAGINQLRRAETAQLADFGDATSITMLLADATVRANAVIYTQAGRGILSAIEPHEAPLPAEYIWRLGDRLLTAGGPNRYQAQVSKRLFPGEPVTWSNGSGFFVRGPETAINGVAAIGNRGILCTAEKLYHFFGDGPDDDGANGYKDAIEIDGSIGLMGWASLLLTPLGLMFQGSDGQLWILPVNGEPPQSFRQVQDTMTAFPVVVAAVLSTDEQLASFFCSNAGGTDSRIVSFDLQAKTWIVDEFASATPITAAASYEGRIVYLSAGIAYQERSSHPPASFIEHGIITGDLKPFGGAGQGEFVSVPFLGEIRGDCNLQLRTSINGGTSWTTMTKVHELRTATDAVGSIIRRSWAPLTRKSDRMRLEFMAQTAGSATEGLVFNEFSLELLGATGARRRPAGERG
jgi:hypothetical protein